MRDRCHDVHPRRFDQRPLQDAGGQTVSDHPHRDAQRLTPYNGGALDNGAPGRSRTDMAFQPADFRTHHGFCRRAARVWSLECATTIAAAAATGPRRPLSTPAGGPALAGLARRYLGLKAQGVRRL